MRVAWQPCGSHLEALVLVTAWLAGREGRAATIDVTRRGPAAAWAAVVARVSPGPLFAPDEALRWTVRRGSA